MRFSATSSGTYPFPDKHAHSRAYDAQAKKLTYRLCCQEYNLDVLNLHIICMQVCILVCIWIRHIVRSVNQAQHLLIIQHSKLHCGCAQPLQLPHGLAVYSMDHARLSAHAMLQVDLLDMLYRKSLRLGVDVRNARGAGTVVNLQSNDARKVWMMPVHIHTLWNSPFQVGGIMQHALWNSLSR